MPEIGEQDLLLGPVLFGGGREPTHATLQKETRQPVSHLTFLFYPSCLLVPPIAQTKSAVREQDSPSIKSIQISFLGHSGWCESIKSDWRGENNGNIFSTILLISSVEINGNST